MALFRWRECMRLGVPRIDADHRHLIDLLNRLHYLAFAGADKAATAAVIDELVERADQHFRLEHDLIARSGASGLERHREQHQGLLDRLRQFRSQHRDQPERFDVHALYDFLADWLLLHVMREHARLRKHFGKPPPLAAV